MEQLERKVSICPRYDDLDSIEKQLKKFATKDYVQYVENSIGDFVKREEFTTLSYENT